MLSMNLIIIVAICALVAVPCGDSSPSVTPRIRPLPQAHWIAGMAYSLISAKSS